MFNIRELEAHAKALVPVVREYVSEVFAPLSKRLDDAERRLKDCESVDIPELDLDGIAAKAASMIQIPEPIAGKDADPEQIKALVAEAVAQIPAPKDGESVTAEQLGPVIAEEVSKAVAGIPKPQDGKSVPIQDVQRMIDEAVDKRMQSLDLPKDGEPGRDALALEILPAIEEVKSYARGTYAKHANGLWRAYERTHGMKGWECIVAGVAALEIIEGDDSRQVSVKTMLSDGTEQLKSFHFPAMVYRGVFKSGMYASGDTVTWGGSLWHCDEPTEDKPGEVNSKGWTLAAKRGTNGKDGRNGIDKTAPVKLS